MRRPDSIGMEPGSSRVDSHPYPCEQLSRLLRFRKGLVHTICDSRGEDSRTVLWRVSSNSVVN